MKSSTTSKIALVRAKSKAAAEHWVRQGADSVPGEDEFVLTNSRFKIPNDVVRIGKTHKKRKALEFATERVLVEFEDPTPEPIVKTIVGSDAISVRPLEKGVSKDWTWIVKLKPELDPEVKAKEMSRHERVLCAEPDRVRMVKKSKSTTLPV